MSKVATEVELEESLLRRVEDTARQTGLTPDELIESSLRRAFASQMLGGILSRARRNGLSDRKAEAIAREELTQVRRERRQVSG